MKISALIVTHNDASSIMRCLSSIEQVVDEILIVDLGSNDGTIEIAKGFSPKISFFHHKCEDEMSRVRNFMVQNAKYDWCFVLHANEYLNPSSKDVFRSSLREFSHSLNRLRYVIHCKTISVAGEANYEDARIFCRDISTKFLGRVHEYIEKLDPIQVFSHDICIIRDEETNNKINQSRKLSLLMRQIEEDPDNLRWFYYFLPSVENESKEQARIFDRFKNADLPYPRTSEFYLNVNLCYIRYLINTENYTYALYFIRKLLRYYDSIEVAMLNFLVEAEISIADRNINYDRLLKLYDEAKSKPHNPMITEMPPTDMIYSTLDNLKINQRKI
ncbi:MAG: glycosyltransferase [Pseudobacteriovorax sp.]|nr:glycosyltransferase [Pseudobacteriovorax sp.]